MLRSFPESGKTWLEQICCRVVWVVHFDYITWVFKKWCKWRGTLSWILALIPSVTCEKSKYRLKKFHCFSEILKVAWILEIFDNVFGSCTESVFRHVDISDWCLLFSVGAFRIKEHDYYSHGIFFLWFSIILSLNDVFCSARRPLSTGIFSAKNVTHQPGFEPTALCLPWWIFGKWQVSKIAK